MTVALWKTGSVSVTSARLIRTCEEEHDDEQHS